MSDLRRLAEKFGITRKRWFANLIESKGLTKIEDIEHELKHADENYLLDEAVEYKKLKERYKDDTDIEIQTDFSSNREKESSSKNSRKKHLKHCLDFLRQ